MSSKKKKIKVLIVDDSAVARDTLRDILSTDSAIEVIGTAADPYIAAKKMSRQVPDVIILDVEMPRMDGLTFLRKIMTQHPLPVVMCSALTVKGCETTLKALEYGAVDIIQKPKIGTKEFFETSRIHVCDVVKAASVDKLKTQIREIDVVPKLTADVIMAKPRANRTVSSTDKVVLVGASTGGIEALRVFLEGLPFDVPGLVIVQHLPEHFTAAFANRLNSQLDLAVKEAEDGDIVRHGLALIAPGDHHILLKRGGRHYYVELRDGPLVCRHRPSIDVLFRSAARYAGKNAVGVIMTGMGDDGARGMEEMKSAGAYNIAQDEKSCVVFGMPKEAISKGAVDLVRPLERLATEVVRATATVSEELKSR